MPTHSPYPPISIPPVDVWTFLFERADREYPEDHVIFVDISSRKEYTFRELLNTSEQIGRGLQHHWRWQKGDVMALFAPNSADIAAITFGTHWAGGVICPINNLFTVGELASHLKLSGAKGLTTHLAGLEVACEAALIAGLPLDRIILIGDSDPKGRAKHFSSLRSTTKLVEKVSIIPKEDIAYLVYSSGTTGLPKGVMLSHENIVANTLQNSIPDEDMTNWKNDRSIGFLPMYHIYGIAVLLLLPLSRGITMYIMQRFDLEQLCLNIQRHIITTIYVVPPVVLHLAKHPLIDKYNLSSLRVMHSSAAPLSHDLVRTAYNRLKVPIKQGYGMTEASPGIATQSWFGWNKSIGSVGRPLPSVSLKIMIGEKEALPGQEGEIWIKGPNVFKGYYKNKKATAESLIDGWFRSGDIGYIDRDNNIYITDRFKELIKYNGFQVAPAELEGLLLGHPAVSDVAVIGIYNSQLATELPRAYVVHSKGHTACKELAEEISHWLHQKVAPYKRLRGGIRFTDQIPKSAAGKVLRRVLVDQAKKEEAEKTPGARL